MAKLIVVLAKPRRGSSNPVNELLYSAVEDAGAVVREFAPGRMLLGRYDILHVHWPENAVNTRSWLLACAKVFAFLLALEWLRLRRKHLIWTVHNLESHEKRHPKLEGFYMRRLLRRAAGLIFLTPESRHAFYQRYPNTRDIPAAVIPHGHYRDVYPNSMSRSESRASLGLPRDARIITNVGMIRPYKNVEALIALAKEHPEVHVVIAGKPESGEYAQALRSSASGAANIHLYLGFIPDDQLQRYVKAADLFVVPFEKITNSGSAIMALSFGVPVLVPEMEVFNGLLQRFGGRFVFTYPPGDPAEADIADAIRQHAAVSDAAMDWADMDWGAIGPKTVAFYRGVVDADPS
jgi:glycosyltransferase involved in cell wall biosynthesis